MKWLVVVVASCLAASVCFGQVKNYGTQSGYGNVLYPGTGHAPNVPNSGLYGSGVYGRPAQVNPQANRAFRGGSNRTLVVPFPVYYGPLGYGYDQSGGGPPPSQESNAPPIINTNAAPSVVINQTFVPDRAMPVMQDYNGMNLPPPGPGPEQGGMRMYQGPPPAAMPDPRAARHQEEIPTLYLIAFKDHTIVQALGYWVEDGNLHYVSAEHTLNQVSLDLLDRSLSQRLNDERNVEFKLPK